MTLYEKYYEQMVKNFEEPIDYDSWLLIDIVDEFDEFYRNFDEKGIYTDRDIFTKIDNEKFKETDQFQASIKLQCKRTIPPKHSILIESSANYSVKHVLFSYEYSYGFVANFIFTQSDAIKKLLFILRSVHWINRCRMEYQSLAEKRFAKLRFSEKLSYWDDLFLISEIQNKKYTEALEKWIDENLSVEQKNEQILAYENYWDGIPKQNRHIVTTSF